MKFRSRRAEAKARRQKLMRRRHGNRKSPAKTGELPDVSANSKKADHKPRLRGYDILQQVDADPVDLIRSAANSVGIPREGAPLGQCFEPGYRVGNRRPPGGALANFSTRPDSKKKSWLTTKSGEVPIASEVAPQKNDAEGWILVRQPRRKKGEGVTSTRIRDARTEECTSSWRRPYGLFRTAGDQASEATSENNQAGRREGDTTATARGRCPDS